MQNQHLRLTMHPFLKQSKVLRLLPATPRVDATASGQQRELRGLCTTSCIRTQEIQLPKTAVNELET